MFSLDLPRFLLSLCLSPLVHSSIHPYTHTTRITRRYHAECFAEEQTRHCRHPHFSPASAEPSSKTRPLMSCCSGVSIPRAPPNVAFTFQPFPLSARPCEGPSCDGGDRLSHEEFARNLGDAFATEWADGVCVTILGENLFLSPSSGRGEKCRPCVGVAGISAALTLLLCLIEAEEAPKWLRSELCCLSSLASRLLMRVASSNTELLSVSKGPTS